MGLVIKEKGSFLGRRSVEPAYDSMVALVGFESGLFDGLELHIWGYQRLLPLIFCTYWAKISSGFSVESIQLALMEMTKPPLFLRKYSALRPKIRL